MAFYKPSRDLRVWLSAVWLIGCAPQSPDVGAPTSTADVAKQAPIDPKAERPASQSAFDAVREACDCIEPQVSAATDSIRIVATRSPNGGWLVTVDLEPAKRELGSEVSVKIPDDEGPPKVTWGF